MLCGRGVLCWFCADCIFSFAVCVSVCAISSIDTTVIKPVIQGQACVCMSVCISSHTLPEGHVSLSHAHTRVIPDE